MYFLVLLTAILHEPNVPSEVVEVVKVIEAVEVVEAVWAVEDEDEVDEVEVAEAEVEAARRPRSGVLEKTTKQTWLMFTFDSTADNGRRSPD